MTSPAPVDQFDSSDIKALKTEMNNLSKSMEKLSATLEQNTRQLSKIEVLEVNHNHQSEALGRAFTAVSDLEVKVDTHKKEDTAAHDVLATSLATHAKENAGEHRSYDRFLYMCIGFVTAVSLFWTVFGIRINNTIDDTIKSVADLKTLISVEAAVKASRPPAANGSTQ